MLITVDYSHNVLAKVVKNVRKNLRLEHIDKSVDLVDVCFEANKRVIDEGLVNFEVGILVQNLLVGESRITSGDVPNLVYGMGFDKLLEGVYSSELGINLLRAFERVTSCFLLSEDELILEFSSRLAFRVEFILKEH